jgi:hypothetical protein
MKVMVDQRFCLSEVERRGCFNNDGGHTPMVTTNLRDLDAEWRANLQRPGSPPLLGLAPLAAADQAALSSAVDHELGLRLVEPAQRVDGWISLLARYPAAMAVWLSRLAGEVYQDGSFWDNFAAKLHCAEVPHDRRPQFAAAFRRACRAVMVHFVTPDLGSRRYVGEFLFQAGLPLCHCGRVAAALRTVADAYGLPEPNDLEALRDVRDAMLVRAEIWQAPMLRKALEAESGLHLLAATVRVVREDAFALINPLLGQKLRETFATATSGAREAVRWPFLQLAEDLTSFVVVGPRQPAAVVGHAGIRWVVNGVPYRVGVNDEFIFPVTKEDRVRVELLGLIDRKTLQRDFNLHPKAERVAAFVFSGTTRRRVRGADTEQACHQLEAGGYWVVHPASFSLDEAIESHAWTLGPAEMEPLMTSRLELRPGSVAVLRDASGEQVCEFRAAARPFIELPGSRVFDADGECLHYGWASLPSVWIPVEDQTDSWVLRVAFDNQERTYTLTPAQSQSEGILSRFAPVAAEDMIAKLPPALYAVRLELLRDGRYVAERSAWLWHGLEGIQTDGGLRCHAWPRNLIEREMRGFERHGAVLDHAPDNLHLHSLAFRVGERHCVFSWHRPGVFIESFEKVPGRPVYPIPHELGETFSAAVDSTRWLRLWRVPAQDSEVLVNDEVITRFGPGSQRCFVDVSLAQCAATHPGGGPIVLRQGEMKVLLARFARPLTASSVHFSANGHHRSLTCQFRERIGGVRLNFRELVSHYHGEQTAGFTADSTQLLVHEPGCPPIECANIENPLSNESCSLTLRTPANGWPAGIWIVDAQIRRVEGTDWQPLTDERGGRLPLVLVQLPDVVSATTNYRARCLWVTFWNPARAGRPGDPSAEGHEAELAALIGEVRAWLGPKVHGYVWNQIKPLEDLYKWLVRQASWLLRNRRDGVLPCLAEQLVADPGLADSHSLLAWLPDLLAQPAAFFTQVPSSDALRGALRWCSALGEMDLPPVGLPMVNVTGGFGIGEPSPLAPVLRRFDQRSPSRRRMPGTPSIHFDYDGWFREIGINVPRDLTSDFDTCEALSADHFAWAMQMFQSRVYSRGDANFKTIAGTIYHAADRYYYALRQRIPRIARLLAGMRFGGPWARLEIPDSDFETSALRFASVFALAARAVAAGWSSYPEATGWLFEEFHQSSGPKRSVISAITTLFMLAPELLGFHLMFWELMIRTYPHD